VSAASLWLSAAVGVGSGGALYLVSIYVVILVIMILRYAPRSYLLGLDEDDEEEEEEIDSVGEEDIETEKQGVLDSKIPEAEQSNGKNNTKDVEEDEAMDMLSSIRRSTHGRDPSEYLAPMARSSSNSMIKSKSTPSLRASVRARVPTFAE
jgi:uncharacterized membrane protein YhiD involved in acid resistance